MKHKRNNVGVCSSSTELEINEQGLIENVVVAGGCDGNLKGIMSLLKGMKAEKAIELLKGIDCKGRGTSCPDQISLALQEALDK